MAHCCDWTVLSAATYPAVARPVAVDGLAVVLPEVVDGLAAAPPVADLAAECVVHGVAEVDLAVVDLAEVGLAVVREACGLAVV